MKEGSSVPDLLQAKPPYRELQGATATTIVEALRQLRETDGQHAKMMALVGQLCDVHGQGGTAFVYETLVKANCCIEGSADQVRELLKEMRQADREGLSSATYHAALRVRASSCLVVSCLVETD